MNNTKRIKAQKEHKNAIKIDQQTPRLSKTYQRPSL